MKCCPSRAWSHLFKGTWQISFLIHHMLIPFFFFLTLTLSLEIMNTYLSPCIAHKYYLSGIRDAFHLLNSPFTFMPQHLCSYLSLLGLLFLFIQLNLSCPFWNFPWSPPPKAEVFVPIMYCFNINIYYSYPLRDQPPVGFSVLSERSVPYFCPGLTLGRLRLHCLGQNTGSIIFKQCLWAWVLPVTLSPGLQSEDSNTYSKGLRED